MPVSPGRFLVVTYDGGGNRPPTVAIAQALRGRGHDVRFLGNPVQKARLEAEGFAFAAYETSPAWDWATPGLEVTGSWFTEQPTLVEDVGGAVDRYRPDALLVDCLLTPALAAAELAGLPTAVLVHTLSCVYTANWERWLSRRPGAAELRHSLGLPAVTTVEELWSRFSLCLVAALPTLDRVSNTRPPGLYHVGPLFDEPSDAQPWASPWPADDSRPLVLVSLTTRFDRRLLEVLQRVLDGLAEAPVRVFLTTGPALDPSLLRAPDNAVVKQFVHHDLVMPQASLAITHGGHGTTMTALAHAVPVISRLFGDQPDVAASVADAGGGEVLAWDASPAEIRETVDRLLAEPRYRAAALRLAGLIAEQGGAARAADLLETLLA